MNKLEKTDKLIKTLLAINVLLIAVLISATLHNDNNVEIDYDVLSYKVANHLELPEEIDYDKIDIIVRDSQEERFNDIEKQIEQSIETKYEEMDKDFGEKFEEMTTYFGGKITETFNNISDQFKN